MADADQVIDDAVNMAILALREARAERDSARQEVADLRKALLSEQHVSIDLIEILEEALTFIGEEADNRAAAGSEMSDYEREPRELAERIAHSLSLLEGR